MATANRYTEEQNTELNMFDCWSFRIKTPDGPATINISENADGSIYRVEMLIGKAGSSLSAFCNALSRMTGFAIQHVTLDKVIEELQDISSDRFVFENGIAVRSAPEALSMALQRYKQIRRL